MQARNSLEFLAIEITNDQFQRIKKIVYDVAGIALADTKIGLVKSRLMRRIRTLNLNSYDEYIDFVEQETSGKELSVMIDKITTNKTSFFRESQHFDFLRDKIIPVLKEKKGPIRFWCAGCSTGAEPYTLMMVMNQNIPALDRLDFKYLATDISDEMLEIAKKGIYNLDALQDVPEEFMRKFVVKTANYDEYQMSDTLKKHIKFAHHNLMSRWPMQGPFDVIFCRNVMIYFDKESKERLIHNFTKLLGPNGYLFVGHSESLSSISHNLKYIQPAVYQKVV